MSLPVLSDIGNVHDSGQAGASFMIIDDSPQCPKPARESDLRQFIQTLTTDKSYAVFIPSLLDVMKIILRERIPQIQSGNLDTARARQWFHRQFSNGLWFNGHSKSTIKHERDLPYMSTCNVNHPLKQQPRARQARHNHFHLVPARSKIAAVE